MPAESDSLRSVGSRTTAPPVPVTRYACIGLPNPPTAMEGARGAIRNTAHAVKRMNQGGVNSKRNWTAL
ncbi:MAG: hypothetical protein ACYC0Z_13850 [Acidobacteriaceae bacterium]